MKKLAVTDKKLIAVLKLRFAKREVDKKLVDKFRRFIDRNEFELQADERSGVYLDGWLKDMVKYFKEMYKDKLT